MVFCLAGPLEWQMTRLNSRCRVWFWLVIRGKVFSFLACLWATACVQYSASFFGPLWTGAHISAKKATCQVYAVVDRNIGTVVGFSLGTWPVFQPREGEKLMSDFQHLGQRFRAGKKTYLRKIRWQEMQDNRKTYYIFKLASSSAYVWLKRAVKTISVLTRFVQVD